MIERWFCVGWWFGFLRLFSTLLVRDREHSGCLLRFWLVLEQHHCMYSISRPASYICTLTPLFVVWMRFENTRVQTFTGYPRDPQGVSPAL